MPKIRTGERCYEAQRGPGAKYSLGKAGGRLRLEGSRFFPKGRICKADFKTTGEEENGNSSASRRTAQRRTKTERRFGAKGGERFSPLTNTRRETLSAYVSASNSFQNSNTWTRTRSEDTGAPPRGIGSGESSSSHRHREAAANRISNRKFSLTYFVVEKPGGSLRVFLGTKVPLGETSGSTVSRSVLVSIIQYELLYARNHRMLKSDWKSVRRPSSNTGQPETPPEKT